jgi:hypothetical protein
MRSPRNGEYSPAKPEDLLHSPKFAEPPSPGLFSPRSDARESSVHDGTSSIEALQTRERADIESRDQQNAVLMSQIAELSTSWLCTERIRDSGAANSVAQV